MRRSNITPTRRFRSWSSLAAVLACAVVGCSSETPDTMLDAGEAIGIDAPVIVDAGPPRHLCRPRCESAADCAASPEAAALFACTSGACVYLGCDTDAQCATGTRCAMVGRTRSCIEACTTTDDCAETGANSYGPSECIEGVCRWQGCPDDAYCAMLGPTYRCLDRRPDEGVRACEAVCASDAECDLPGWGGLLACLDGVCGFPDCTPDEGCADRFGSPNVCVPI